MKENILKLKFLFFAFALIFFSFNSVYAVEYHANPSSMVFHHPDCQHYNSKSATEKFNSKEKAVVAGYKPCKLCFIEEDGKIQSKKASKQKSSEK